MNFRRAFRFLTMATVLWAFLTLAATGEVHLPAIVAFLAFYLVALKFPRAGLAVHNAIWVVFSLSALALASVVWVRMGERLYAVTYFLLYLEINKLLTSTRNRDYLQLFGLTFFHILLAAVSTTSPTFAPMLFVYLALVIGALIAFNMKRDAESALAGARVPRRATAWAPRRVAAGDRNQLRLFAESVFLTRRTGWTLALSTAGVVMLGVVVFWIVPRASNQRFLPGLGTNSNTPRKSAFAENVTFGGMGEIQNDPTIVMRAQIIRAPESGRPTFLRIRGTALDEFTGRQWRRSRRGSLVSGDYGGNEVEMVPRSLADQMGEPITVRMMLEPETSQFLFTVDRPYKARFSDRTPILLDPERLSLQFPSPRFLPFTFEVESRLQDEEESSAPLLLAAPTDDDASVDPSLDLVQATRRRVSALPDALGQFLTATVSGEARPSYDRVNLQLPIGHPDMQVVQDLARSWTQGIGDKRSMAREIERRFRTEFGYSTDISFSNREKHLTYFLRVERRGHCEYFATAMALMLRSLGIPARVVNGYLTDEWTMTGGGRFIVRQEHAHSWVEAQFEGSPVWYTFDPTPASGVGSNRIEKNLYHHITTLLDSVKLLWYSGVVDFDQQDQQKTVMSIIRWMHRFGERSGEGMRDISSWWRGGTASTPTLGGRKVLGIGLLICAVGIGTALVLRFGKGGGPKVDAGARGVGGMRAASRSVPAYRALLDAGQRVRPRPPAQTPLAYARALGELLADHQGEMDALTEAYYAARFDGAAWTDVHEARAKAIAAALTQLPSAKQSSAAPQA